MDENIMTGGRRIALNERLSHIIKDLLDLAGMLIDIWVHLMVDVQSRC